MACWRVLELSDSSDPQHVPQLLIKPEFADGSYTVFLTDLSSIWSEELDLNGIIERTAQQESPIEVSRQDTSQLAILLDTVRKTLAGAEDASCSLTRDGTDGLILHTTIKLPEPLDSFTWKFNLERRTPITLKNELILPLLVSSHIQHNRLHSLTSLIDEKDKAITRLVDQFEASNLDLATAFPSVGGSKAGRRLVKREQAAKQIPALRPFDGDAWKTETGEVQDLDLSSFGLFQDALSECTPKVPSHLESKEDQDAWWTTLSTSFRKQKPSAKRREVQTKPRAKSPLIQKISDDETEDEFETHEHFYQREASKEPHRKSPSPKATRRAKRTVITDDDATEDDDLDAPPRSQSQRQVPSPTSKRSANARSPELGDSTSPEPAAAVTRKAKGFRIGGTKAKTSAQPAIPPANEELKDVSTKRNVKEPEPMQVAENSTSSAPTKARKTFKIGGKSKDAPRSESANKDTGGLSQRLKGEEAATQGLDSPRKDRGPYNAATQDHKASTSNVQAELVNEEREETYEEKAERRRRELKRRNEEELAKKQAQKKKKRF
ncbi:XRCC4-like factor-domain-containing protein [Lophiotrema nucula]|uniref:Non-homologous end-joining factor 1 n=1 Tax=Lophiotrema nucula TaxID=690887 RepID=A0A6A5YVY0_9PLEO|nr:XRCC4-like factor-domain-containing protein [Lophiotrema nucula]